MNYQKIYQQLITDQLPIILSFFSIVLILEYSLFGGYISALFGIFSLGVLMLIAAYYYFANGSNPSSLDTREKLNLLSQQDQYSESTIRQLDNLDLIQRSIIYNLTPVKDELVKSQKDMLQQLNENKNNIINVYTEYPEVGETLDLELSRNMNLIKAMELLSVDKLTLIKVFTDSSVDKSVLFNYYRLIKYLLANVINEKTQIELRLEKQNKFIDLQRTRLANNNLKEYAKIANESNKLGANKVFDRNNSLLDKLTIECTNPLIHADYNRIGDFILNKDFFNLVDSDFGQIPYFKYNKNIIVVAENENKILTEGIDYVVIRDKDGKISVLLIGQNGHVSETVKNLKQLDFVSVYKY